MRLIGTGNDNDFLDKELHRVSLAVVLPLDGTGCHVQWGVSTCELFCCDCVRVCVCVFLLNSHPP